MSRMLRRFYGLCALAAVLACSACVGTQKVPVSTDPVGALVYLDGAQVCAATPCSVEMSTDQAHLLTIVKPEYAQKDIAVRSVPVSGGGRALSPELVSLKLYKPGELNVRDQDSVVDTAVGLGMGVLKRVLDDLAKPPAR